MPVPKAKADQKSSVPAAGDQASVVPDGKTAISPAVARTLIGANGSLPEKYFVDESMTSQPNEPPLSEDMDEAEGLQGDEGETGTPAQAPENLDDLVIPGEEPPKDPDPEPAPTEPEKDPEQTAEPAKPTLDKDGYEHGDIGGIPYRKDADGNVQMFAKVDGKEMWVNSDKFQAGYQFNQHNQVVAQENAAKQKQLDDQLSLDAVLDKFAPQPTVPAEGEPTDPGYDDFFDQPTGNKEVDDLRKQVVHLTKKDQEREAQAAQNVQAQKAIRVVDSARDEMLALCDHYNLERPDQKTIIAMVDEHCENTDGANIAEIIVSPTKLFDVVKKNPKLKKTGSPTADSTGKPPTASAVRRSAPAPSAELKKLEAEKVELQKKAREPGGDEGAVANDLIKLQRKINAAKGK